MYESENVNYLKEGLIHKLYDNSYNTPLKIISEIKISQKTKIIAEKVFPRQFSKILSKMNFRNHN